MIHPNENEVGRVAGMRRQGSKWDREQREKLFRIASSVEGIGRRLRNGLRERDPVKADQAMVDLEAHGRIASGWLEPIGGAG